MREVRRVLREPRTDLAPLVPVGKDLVRGDWSVSERVPQLPVPRRPEVLDRLALVGVTGLRHENGITKKHVRNRTAEVQWLLRLRIGGWSRLDLALSSRPDFGSFGYWQRVVVGLSHDGSSYHVCRRSVRRWHPLTYCCFSFLRRDLSRARTRASSLRHPWRGTVRASGRFFCLFVCT